MISMTKAGRVLKTKRQRQFLASPQNRSPPSLKGPAGACGKQAHKTIEKSVSYSGTNSSRAALKVRPRYCQAGRSAKHAVSQRVNVTESTLLVVGCSFSPSQCPGAGRTAHFNRLNRALPSYTAAHRALGRHPAPCPRVTTTAVWKSSQGPGRTQHERTPPPAWSSTNSGQPRPYG